MNISIGGSISAVISPSTLRSDKRNARAIRTCRSVSERYVSVIVGCSLVRRGGLAGERQEDVVEAGADQRETVDQGASRIELVQPGADRAGASIAGDDEAQRVRFGGDRERSGARCQLPVGLRSGRGQLQPVIDDPAL